MSLGAIRNKFIQEANNSLNMFSDIAGMEGHISESYKNRSFIELLQNADDAGAKKFLISKLGDFLLIANDGREFTEDDLVSLCRSASSKKVRGTSIGYRGIGFKSVVSIAKEVHIISGDLMVTFSRELTKDVVPGATRVPLVRIPHPLKQNVYNLIKNAILQLNKDGSYTTFFVFSGVDFNQIKESYEAIDNSSLLFLHNIQEVCNNLLKSKIEIVKEAIPDLNYHVFILSYGEILSEWKIYTDNNVSIAFSVKDGKIQRLNREDALAYAFLPTEDVTGIGVLVNADFSTDPSRRHIILDDLSKENIDSICKTYMNLFMRYISESDENSENIINALYPHFEPTMINIAGNQLEKYFIEQIKDIINLSKFAFRPTWLNKQDFLKLSKCLYVRAIPFLDTSSIFRAFVKYLGAQELSVDSISNSVCIRNTDLSVMGVSQIASKIIKDSAFGFFDVDISVLALFYSNNQRDTLVNINTQKRTIDDSFVTTLVDNGVNVEDLKRIFKYYNLDYLLDNFSNEHNHTQSQSLDKAYSEDNLDSKDDIFEDGLDKTESEEGVTLKADSSAQDSQLFTSLFKWKSAEQQVLNALNQNGYELEDVSVQNLGYDLEGRDPNGDKIYIEVKSISYVGQNFRMTNNEYAVAQVKGNAYVVAVTYLKNNELYIGMYRNPIHTLHLDRQCVQWVWQCSEYSYKPKFYKI